SPAVIRVLARVVATCNAAHCPVTLCGEMAGEPTAFVLLLGMGLRRFSMSPAFVPAIKELATHVTIAQAEALLARAQQERTTRRIQKMVTAELLTLAPNLKPILMR